MAIRYFVRLILAVFLCYLITLIITSLFSRGFNPMYRFPFDFSFQGVLVTSKVILIFIGICIPVLLNILPSVNDNTMLSTIVYLLPIGFPLYILVQSIYRLINATFYFNAPVLFELSYCFCFVIAVIYLFRKMDFSSSNEEILDTI